MIERLRDHDDDQAHDVDLLRERPPLPEHLQEVGGVVWAWAVCPSCGGDWWLGAEPGEEPDESDHELMRLVLGRCADCTERDPDNGVARRVMNRRQRRHGF